MSTHHIAPLSGTILDEATAWFVEFNEDEVTQPERERFIQWLKTSPEHVRAYLQITAHWEDARVLDRPALPGIDELVTIGRQSSTNVIPLGDVRETIREDPRSNLSSNGFATTRRWLLVAGLAVVTLGGCLLYYIQSQRGVYVTQPGEQRSITLEDGSTVELNSRSKIRVEYHFGERDVELLMGQALFRVAKDHARPFVVQSGATKVRAVGTEFDVYKHATDVTVTVVEGRVAVFPSSNPSAQLDNNLATPEPLLPAGAAVPASSRAALNARGAASGSGSSSAGVESTSEILVAAGEQVTVSTDTLARNDHPDIAAATAWTQNQLVFNATPLSEVAEEFNRYNTRQLVITDARIANTRVSGVFSSTNPGSLLRGLDAMNQFKIRESADRIEVSGR